MSESARKVRAAAVQLTPVLYSRKVRRNTCATGSARLARKAPVFVVFPETVVPYYPYFSFIKPPVQMGADHLLLMEQSVDVPGPTTERIDAQRASMEWWWSWASTSATTARSTTPS